MCVCLFVYRSSGWLASAMTDTYLSLWMLPAVCLWPQWTSPKVKSSSRPRRQVVDHLHLFTSVHHPSVCPSVHHPCVCLSAHHPCDHLSIHKSTNPPIHLSTLPSVHQPLRPRLASSWGWDPLCPHCPPHLPLRPPSAEPLCSFRVQPRVTSRQTSCVCPVSPRRFLPDVPQQLPQPIW